MKKSKTGRLLLALLACGAVSAQATLLSYESFSGYTDNTQLDAQTAPAVTGYTGDWVAVGWGDQHILSSSSGLNYTGVPTTGGSVGVPSAVMGQGTSGRNQRQMDGTISADAGTVGTIYMSFLYQNGMEGTPSIYQALELYNGIGDVDTNRMFQLGTTSGNNFVFGAGDAAAAITIAAADSSVHQFVVKFDLSASAGGDSATVWIDPTSETGGITSSGLDLAWNTLSIGDYDENSASWDEIRFATTFNEAIPEPATLGLVGIFGVGVLFVRRRLML